MAGDEFGTHEEHLKYMEFKSEQRTLAEAQETNDQLARVRREVDQLKNQNALLLTLAKQAIVQNITKMDIAQFLQFATAYEELQKGR